MNETQTDELEKTADGEPLIDRGTAGSANDSVTEPEEDDDEQEDDGEEKEDEEDVDV